MIQVLVESCLTYDVQARPSFHTIHKQLMDWITTKDTEALGAEDLRPPAFLYPAEDYRQACGRMVET